MNETTHLVFRLARIFLNRAELRSEALLHHTMTMLQKLRSEIVDNIEKLTGGREAAAGIAAEDEEAVETAARCLLAARSASLAFDAAAACDGTCGAI